MIALESLYPMMYAGIVVLVVCFISRQQHQPLALAAAWYTCALGFIATGRPLLKALYVAVAVGAAIAWAGHRRRVRARRT